MNAAALDFAINAVRRRLKTLEGLVAETPGQRALLGHCLEQLSKAVDDLQVVSGESQTADKTTESSADAVAIADLEENLTYVNKAFLKLWGYVDNKEVLGTPATSHWWAPKQAAEVAQTVRTRGAWLGTMVARRKDGTRFDVEVLASLIVDDAGGPLCMLATFADLSGPRHTDEGFRHAQRRLTAIVPEDRQSVLAHLADIVRGSYDMEYRIRRPDGSVRWIHDRAFPVSDEAGETGRIAGVAEDITERKLAEKALRDSEAKLRGFYDNAPTLMGIVELTEDDREIIHIYVNPASKRFFGRPEAESLEDVPLRDLGAPPEVVGIWIRHFRESQGNGRPVSFEYEHRASQQIGWISVTVFPIGRGPSGRTRFCYMAEDITGRKRAEESLRESEARYRELADSIADVFFAMDRDLRYTYWNKASERMTGIPARDAIGKSLFDLFPEARGTQIEELYLKALHLKQPQHFVQEYNVRGNCFVFEISAYPSEGGISVFTRDITDRRRAEEALRESRERYRCFFENAAVAVAIVDPDGYVADINNTGCRLLGRSRSELVGMHFTEFTHPGDVEFCNSLYQSMISGGRQDYEVEQRYVRRSGEVVWGRLAVSLMRDSQGLPLYASVVCADITDRKRAEDQARRRQAELAHASRLATMGEMVAGLAHELNQPLTGVVSASQGALRMLGAKRIVRDDLSQALRVVLDQGRRAGRIISHVREFLRKQKPRRSIVSINDLVREATSLLQLEPRSRDLKIQFAFGHNMPSILADPIEIEQVILNLAYNGIEAMEQARPADRVLSIMTSTIAKGNVQVAVRDNGGGLSPDIASQLFHAFVTSKPQGMGMGLLVSRSIIESHGGHIWAVPNPDRGMTFFFTIPSIREAEHGHQADHIRGG